MSLPIATPRRSFIKSVAALLAASSLGSHSPGATTPAAARVGIQLFSLPKRLDEDLPGSLALLAAMGYREVELYGPYPFSDPAAHERWARVTPSLGFKGSGYFGRSGTELQAMLQDSGLAVPSLHTDLATLQNAMPALAAAAQSFGAKYVTLPSIPEARRQTLDDYRRTADDFNAIGAAARREGVTFAYHNHGYGWSAVDGTVPMEMFLARTDPALVALELDVFWTAAAGVDPLALLRRHRGRYALLHLKDMARPVRFSGDGGSSAQWIELFPHMTTAGDGVLPLADLIREARAGGTRHVIVEQDMVAAPEVALKRSHDYVAAQ
ncbi:MAG TPA: sugar phosphate isomerase/epimerase [Opitutaceae bacterium]